MEFQRSSAFLHVHRPIAAVEPLPMINPFRDGGTHLFVDQQKKKTSAVFSKAPSVSMQQYSRILRETACCARSIHSPVHFSRYTHLRQQPGLLHLGVGDAVILIYSRHLLRTFKVEQGGVFAASRRHPSPAQITISAIK